MSLSSLPLKRLGEVLELQQRALRPKPGASYRLAGVRLYGKGCRIQDGTEEDAHKAPTLSQIRAGNIIYNKMWASKGAFALVGDRFDGCWVTSEYPIFSTRDGCCAEYLRYVFEQPWFWALAKAWSSGTTTRARLQPRDFLRIPAPIPGSEQQRVIVEVLGSANDGIAKARRLIDHLECVKQGIMATAVAQGIGTQHAEYKETPFGRIPTSWELRQVGTLANFTGGNGFRPADWGDKGLPIIRIQNLNGSRQFDYFGGKPDPDWVIKPGTLLFAWAGSRGVSFGPRIWDGPTGVLNQHIYQVHPHKGVDKRYLYWVLWQITERIERKAHGFKTTLVHVHKSDITEATVPFPPPEEQQAIAMIGELLERRIAAERAYLDQLQETKRGLAQALLSGRVRVPPQAVRREKA